MKDDIKTSQNSQPQFQPLASPPKTIDGISPPAAKNPQAASLPPSTNTQFQNQPSPQENHQEAASKQAIQQPNSKGQPSIPKKVKTKRDILPIVIAVIVLLALSSLAIYLGLIRNNNPNGNGATTAQQENVSSTSEDTQAVQETINQIDNLPEDSDASGSNLSDEKLGL